MFSKIKTTKFTENYLEKIKQLKQEIGSAEAIVIGAGAGLSTSAGFTYSGERFEKYFSDFEKKYSFHDMYSGGFYPYESLEEFWAYWSRYIFYNRYVDCPKDTYKKLFEIFQKKNYFIITTNVDHCFQKVGFDKERIFYTQGDYGLFQCSVPCHNKTYDNEEIVLKMLKEQKNMRIPSELIPRCPICNSPMNMNLRADNTFVEDDGWNKAACRYESFIQENMNKHILYLELGVGYNTPGIIKYSFWQRTFENKKAIYSCLNIENIEIPKEIKKQSICIKEDIDKILTELRREGI